MLREPLSLGWDGPSSWMVLDAWESAANRGEAYPAGMGSGCGSVLGGPLDLWEAPGPEAVTDAGLVEGQIPLV